MTEIFRSPNFTPTILNDSKLRGHLPTFSARLSTITAVVNNLALE